MNVVGRYGGEKVEPVADTYIPSNTYWKTNGLIVTLHFHRRSSHSQGQREPAATVQILVSISESQLHSSASASPSR